MEALLTLPGLIVAAFLSIVTGMWIYGNSSAGRSTGWTFWKMIQVILNPASLKDKREGADFLSEAEIKKFLNHKNEGLLVDGHTSRLSREDSFTHMLLCAPPGSGKSTKYVVPNVLALAHTKDTSLVITDPSGEIYEQTSGILAQKGYDVQIVSPSDPYNSLSYNPLAGIKRTLDIREIAKALVSSNLGAKEGEDTWSRGAESLIRICIKILGLADHQKYLNLPNVLRLIQNCEGDGSGLDAVIAQYGREAEINEFKGLISTNDRAFASYVGSTIDSLSLLTDESISQMMGSNEVDFFNLRKRPTALFIVVPSEQLKTYSSFLSMFYNDMFNSLMQERPKEIRNRGEKCNSIYVLADEAGHGKIPNLPSYLATCRKYDISVSLILQSLGQLEHLYEKETETVLESITHKMFYSGVSNHTGQYIEKLLGKQIVTEVRKDGSEHTFERQLMNADRARVLADDKQIFIAQNKEAIILKNKAFYEHHKMKRMTQIPPLPMKRKEPHKQVEYLPM